MTVIWGLDLHDIQWSCFKSSNMFGNTDYHLRRTKFVVYQLAMVFMVISESLGTDMLSNYTSEQRRNQGGYPGIYLYNNDYVGVASYNIAAGVLIATVFGAAFFFDLFWPDRFEPRWIQNLWQASAIFMCLNGLADALAYTIISCTRGETLHGAENLTAAQQAALRAELASEQNLSPMSYLSSGRVVASIVFLWLGVASTFAATYVMISFYRYVKRTGTAKARHTIMNEKFASDSTETTKYPDQSSRTSYQGSPAAEQAATVAMSTSGPDTQPDARSYTITAPA